jgi:L,D-transpeptidase catalytic domain
MKKYRFNVSKQWGRAKARKAIPLFASFFLAHFALPAGNITDKHNTSVFTVNPDTLRFINFELDMLKIYEDAGLAAAGLSLEVFNKAMVGYLNLKHAGAASEKALLTIADFDQSSSQKRFWVIDLEARQMLFHSLVAHGKNSGNATAETFSNVPNSEMSSLGFYVTQGTYIGKHGLSLKLEGMDKNFNSNAFKRNVVVHGADYVSEDFIQQNGRLGRSQGCPALPMENHAAIIDTIKDGTVLYLHKADAGFYSSLLDTQIAMDTYYNNTGKMG